MLTTHEYEQGGVHIASPICTERIDLNYKVRKRFRKDVLNVLVNTIWSSSGDMI